MIKTTTGVRTSTSQKIILGSVMVLAVALLPLFGSIGYNAVTNLTTTYTVSIVEPLAMNPYTVVNKQFRLYSSVNGGLNNPSHTYLWSVRDITNGSSGPFTYIPHPFGNKPYLDHYFINSGRYEIRLEVWKYQTEEYKSASTIKNIYPENCSPSYDVGDVNTDGFKNSTDTSLINDFFNNNNVGASLKLQCLDVNNDGFITNTSDKTRLNTCASTNCGKWPEPQVKLLSANGRLYKYLSVIFDGTASVWRRVEREIDSAKTHGYYYLRMAPVRNSWNISIYSDFEVNPTNTQESINLYDAINSDSVTAGAYMQFNNVLFPRSQLQCKMINGKAFLYNSVTIGSQVIYNYLWLTDRQNLGKPIAVVIHSYNTQVSQEPSWLIPNVVSRYSANNVYPNILTGTCPTTAVKSTNYDFIDPKLSNIDQL